MLWANWSRRAPRWIWQLSRELSDRAVQRALANWSHAAVTAGGCDPDANAPRWTWTVATRYAQRAEPAFSLDEELGLLPGELSATLAQGVARLGTKMPFEQAVAEQAFFWNVDPG